MVSLITTRVNTQRAIDSDKLINWYNFQAPFYHLWRDRYESQLVYRVASLINSSDRKFILDAGCGSGLFTIGLARLCSQHLFAGVDRSQGMIEVARRQAKRLGLSNVSLRIGDVEALPFADASFAVAVAAGLFCNLNDHSRTLREFGRVLKAGGQVVIVEFDRSSMTRATRVFFNTMIAGYKIISSCFRKFRFAEAWDINSSTVDENSFKETLRDEGFQVSSVERLENHMVLHCIKRG